MKYGGGGYIDMAKKKKKDENDYTITSYNGVVLHILYSSVNFCIAIFRDFKTKNKLKIVCEYNISVGDEMTIYGKWVENTKWGWQFETKTMMVDMDLDKNGLIKFLTKNKDITKVGIATATKIVEKYGDDFENVITNTPEKLTQDLKIKPETVQNLKKVWNTQKEFNSAIVNLSAYPLTQNQIKSLIKAYGNNAIKIIKDNPYTLIDSIKGYGFITADEIAILDGMDRKSDKRLHAAIDHVCNRVIQQSGGHCWINNDDLINQLYKLLAIPREYIIDFVNSKINLEKIKIYEFEGEYRYTSMNLYEYEKFIIDYIKQNSVEIGEFQYKSQLEKFDLDNLNENQKNAVMNSFKYNFSVITGKAGTGKTYVISKIIECFHSIGFNIACVAPTGKAARRMENMTDFPASTIHRFLNYTEEGFRYNYNNKIEEYDLIIVDEFSMVDLYLGYSLLSALGENVRIILVGDHNQLPPIGAGNIFYDILHNRDKLQCKISELTDIMRQAGNLKKNSVGVLDGKISYALEDDWRIAVDDAFEDPINIRKVILQKMAYSLQKIEYDIENIQIIVPMRVRDCGADILNKELQQIIQKTKYGNDSVKITNGPPKLHIHDRVIQNVNDYSIDVMNGTIGNVTNIDSENIITIKFEDGSTVVYAKDDERLKNISLGYALTIHKTQGSEFPCVIVALHSSQYFMLNRNLLYTAITRAKEKVIIIADQKAINYALSKNNYNDRRTNFEYILK